jgi:hypothetical protein
MPEPWIIKIKCGVKFVICPYCGHKSDYPDTYCNKCKRELLSPDESLVVKKEWW